MKKIYKETTLSQKRSKFSPKLFLSLLFIGLLVLTGNSFALSGKQDTHKISGVITAKEDSQPIPGVTVVIKGKTKGTITDLNGNFSLEVSKTDILVFSSIGFVSQEIIVGDQVSIQIVLETTDNKLDEVVVVGYGTMKKRDLTGATVNVGKEAISANIGANIDQALQGRAAGVSAVITSGQPGAAVSIQIRGQSTINAGSTEPLYVIDGIPVQTGSRSGGSVGLGGLGNGSNSTFSGLSNINPADILSMEILKDASATAIYGSQGANGVVLITTKHGKSGDAKFSYEFYTGIQDQVKRIDLMNLREFADFSGKTAAETSGRDNRIEFQDPSILGEGTNWQNAVFRSASMESHQLSASGGSDKVRYFASGSYLKQDGTVVGSDYKRYSARINFDANLNKWMKLGTNVSLASTEEHIGLNNSTEGIISVALRSLPDVAIYNTDGTYSGQQREGAVGNINPIAMANDITNLLKRNNLNGNAFTEISFIKDLVLRTEIGLDISNSNGSTFNPTYQYGTGSNAAKNSVNTAYSQYNQSMYWQMKNFLTYSKTIGKHNATLMVGHEISESKWEFLSGQGSALSSNEIHEPGLGEQSTMKVSSGRGSSSMVSIYSRATYDFESKYYINYIYRIDGSSNFGPNNRWAPFHAIGLAWKINNEEFFKNIPYISNLKLRLGWGQTGNQNIGGYRWGASIGKMPTNLGPGYRQTNLENLSIQWEKQIQSNIGLELSIFDERISLTVDAYLKKSEDMLMDMQLPSYMGTSGNESIRLYAPKGNYGAIENKGLEIALNTRPLKGNLKWESNFQITINRNKLLGLNGTPASFISGSGQWQDEVSRSTIGESLYNYYGYKVVGVYQDKADIENSPKPKKYPADKNYIRGSTTWVGDLKFADLSGPTGVPDGIIDDYDKTNIGSPLPVFTYGFNNTFKYKGFELAVFVMGSYGNKVMNYVGRSLTGMENIWSNQLRTSVDRAQMVVIDPTIKYAKDSYWFNDINNVRLANVGTSIPRSIANDPNENQRISDRYIEDGSYLRIKSLSLSYYIPEKLIGKAGVKSLKVYVTAQNMWTFTKYSGFDPEVGTGQMGDNVSGVDNGRYPSPRIYTLGANITF